MVKFCKGNPGAKSQTSFLLFAAKSLSCSTSLALLSLTKCSLCLLTVLLGKARVWLTHRCTNRHPDNENDSPMGALKDDWRRSVVTPPLQSKGEFLF